VATSGERRLRPVSEPPPRLLHLPQWRLPPWASFWFIVVLALLLGMATGRGLAQPTIDHAQERALSCDRSSVAWRTYAETLQATGNSNSPAVVALRALRLREAQEAWLTCWTPG
jgi:hypothetical protein